MNALSVMVFLVGMAAALVEIDYIFFQYDRHTPAMLRIGSAMQAAGAAFLIFSPILCGGLMAAGLLIFAYFGYSRGVKR